MKRWLLATCLMGCGFVESKPLSVDSAEDTNSMMMPDTVSEQQDTVSEQQDTGDVAEDCPSGVICIDEFPAQIENTTMGGSTDFDNYGCASEVDESGPERIFRIDLEQPGYLAASLGNLPSDVDVDVHILDELDASTCLNRGNWDSGTLLSAGRHWIIVDSWVDGSGEPKQGSFALTLGFIPFDRYDAEGLSPVVLEIALRAFDTAWKLGDTKRFDYAVIDFERPSFLKRLWVLDLLHQDLRHTLYVAHGEGSSDPENTAYAVSFSNINDSHQSSLGLMRAGETYTGAYGYSMKLDGLEEGFNDNVRFRAIVMHPWYASEAMVEKYGEVPNTWGCLGVDSELAVDLENWLTDNTLIFSYYPDSNWLENSTYLNDL